MDQRYLNYSNAPIPSPLKKPFQIEPFNDQYFPTNSKRILKPSMDQLSCLLDKSSFAAHDNPSMLPSLQSLFEDSNLPLPAIESSASAILNLPLSPVQDLSDALFFIHYTPAGTMLRKWYLVQIDMASTLKMNPAYATNGEYWCVFLARHSADKKKSDEFSRWWPEWHSYNRCPISNDIIYGCRYEFRPSSTPPSAKYTQWSTLLPILGESSTVLIGPFTFAPLDSTHRVRHTIHYEHWKDLVTACNFNGILPPTTGSHVSHKIPRRRVQPSWKSKKRKIP